jgi:hypothetical protein
MFSIATVSDYIAGLVEDPETLGHLLEASKEIYDRLHSTIRLLSGPGVEQLHIPSVFQPS